jgi:hypothetical protein
VDFLLRSWERQLRTTLPLFRSQAREISWSDTDRNFGMDGQVDCHQTSAPIPFHFNWLEYLSDLYVRGGDNNPH